MAQPQKPGFRVGVYVYRNADVLTFSSVFGVLSVSRRFDPELDVFLIAETTRPVATADGFTVLPRYALADQPHIDALVLAGGDGARSEMHNQRLRDYLLALPESCLLGSVCTGSWILATAGLLDGSSATNRKEPDRLEASHLGQVPIDRLATLAPTCHISRARLVDAGRVISAAGQTAGLEAGLHLLRRAGYEQRFINEVIRCMEYSAGHTAVQDDLEFAASPVPTRHTPDLPIPTGRRDLHVRL